MLSAARKAGLGLFGRAKADSKRVYCRHWGAAEVLAGRCPGGKAVGADVAAGRLVTLGPGRSGGCVGLGSFDLEGLFDVVSNGQCQHADGVRRQAKGTAPSGFETAFVLDHGNGFLAGVSTAVASFPSGSAERNVLVGVEQVHWDADHAMTALLVFDGQERSSLVGNGVRVAGCGVGGDPPRALGTYESLGAVVESC